MTNNQDNRDLDLLIKNMAAGHQAELPAPGLVWWRAQILRKQAEKERVERPLAIMRMITVGMCVVAILALWVSQRQSLWDLLRSSGLVSLLPFLLGGLALTAAFIALLWRITARA